MENNETFDMKAKLEEMFGNKFLTMEEKFNKDYEILRGFSIEYTEAYHDFQDNIYPLLIEIVNPKKLNQSLDLSKSISETPIKRGGDKMGRSRTPLRSSKQIIKKEELAVDKNSQTQKNLLRDRAKTPMLTTKDKPPKKDLKKDLDNPIAKSSNNLLPANKNSKKEIDLKQSKTIEAKPEKVVRKEATYKPPKRDMTPTPISKKEALDISHDDFKDREINIKNYNTKKASIKELPKDDRMYHTNKRPTVTGLTKVGNDSVSKGRPSKRDSTPLGKKIIQDTNKTNADTSVLNEENGGSTAKENLAETHVKLEVVKKEEEKVSEFNKKVIVDLSTRKKKEFTFSNKTIESLFIASNNSVLEEKLRLSIIISVKEIYNKGTLKNVLKEKIKRLESEVNKAMENPLAKYLDNASLESMIVKQFAPSKTAQNGLNFVTKEEENNLCKKEQPEEILNVFRLVYILLNEPYNDIPPQKLIENLTTVVFEKMNCENLKTLFLNHVSKRTDLEENQFQQIETLMKDYPKILSSPDLLKINRCVSYMTFILKEVCEYVCAKTPDETPLFAIRALNKKVSSLKEKIENFNSILNK